MKTFVLPVLFLLCLSSPALAQPYFGQCYDSDCKTTRGIHFDASPWYEIRAVFAEGVVDSAFEKQAIRPAVALLERSVAHCPTCSHGMAGPAEVILPAVSIRRWRQTNSS